jgi:hypothetical protein
MLMVEVKFFQASMFGKLALKFIHTSRPIVSSIAF